MDVGTFKVADCPGQRIDGDRNTCTEEHQPGVLYRHVDERQVGDALIAPGPGLPSSAADDEAWLRAAKARRRAEPVFGNPVPDRWTDWYMEHCGDLIPVEDAIKDMTRRAWEAGYEAGQLEAMKVR
jgi:hypothetical protein